MAATIFLIELAELEASQRSSSKFERTDSTQTNASSVPAN